MRNTSQRVWAFRVCVTISDHQIVEGLGKRICQDKGPFLLEFDDHLADTKRVYFQIDGEFYQMTKPLK